MKPVHIHQSEELLMLAGQVVNKLEQLNSSERVDDYDMGVQRGKRIALQDIHDSIMRRLSVLLREEG